MKEKTSLQFIKNNQNLIRLTSKVVQSFQFVLPFLIWHAKNIQETNKFNMK